MPRIQRALSLLPVLLLTAPTASSLRAQHDPIVIAMSPCEGKRPVPQFYVKSSRTLARKGTVDVGGEAFDIYLPREKSYSHRPRPEQKSLMVTMTSTYLSVDQDHDGTIGAFESYLAESTLRLGDTKFEVVDLAMDGSSLTIRRTDGPLTGAILGRKAAAFAWRGIDGRALTRDDHAGRVLVIDCWAPT